MGVGEAGGGSGWGCMGRATPRSQSRSWGELGSRCGRQAGKSTLSALPRSPPASPDEKIKVQKLCTKNHYAKVSILPSRSLKI